MPSHHRANLPHFQKPSIVMQEKQPGPRNLLIFGNTGANGVQKGNTGANGVQKASCQNTQSVSGILQSPQAGNQSSHNSARANLMKFEWKHFCKKTFLILEGGDLITPKESSGRSNWRTAKTQAASQPLQVLDSQKWMF